MKKYFLALLALFSLVFEITLSLSPALGFLLYSALILGCLLVLPHSKRLNTEGKLIIAFLILPIMRITELFIGLGNPLNIIVTYFVLLFLSVYYFSKFGMKLGSGKTALNFLPFSVIIGIILGVVGRYLFSFGGSTLGIIFLLPVVSISEEILFRGLLQGLSEEAFGKWSAIVFVSFLYGVFSLSFGIWFGVFMFFANIAICYVYSRTKTIWATWPINLILTLIIFI